nr:adp-ribosylation factor 1 [Quercus suber]
MWRLWDTRTSASLSGMSGARTRFDLCGDITSKTLKGLSSWYIQSTCATSGEGMYEGLDWLSNNIANKA